MSKLRKWLVMPAHGTKPYEVEAEYLEIESGGLFFWVNYADEPFLAMAIGQGSWASCKQVAQAQSASEPPVALNG